MENAARDTLAQTIRRLVTSGKDQLDERQMKLVKTYCKSSDANIQITYDLLMIQLAKNHAQIRFACAQIIIELFNRSHLFRDCLTREFPKFLSLTLGIYQEALPAPEVYASRLRRRVVEALQAWFAKYGGHYKALQLGYDYVRQKLNVDGGSTGGIGAPVLSHAEERRRREKMARKREQDHMKFMRARAAGEKLATTVDHACRPMDAAFALLVPDVGDIFGSRSPSPVLPPSAPPTLVNDGEGATSVAAESRTSLAAPKPRLQDRMTLMGMGSARYQVTLHMDPDNPFGVYETPENRVIYDSLREGLALLQRKLRPAVPHLLARLARLDLGESQAECDQMVEDLTACQRRMAVLLEKCAELGIQVPLASEDNDDDEFEDVDPDGGARDSNEDVPVNPEVHDESVRPQADLEVGSERAFNPTVNGPVAAPSTASLKANNTDGLSEVEKKLLEKAPVIEYGEDLYYWDKKEVGFNQSGIEYKHRFFGEGGGEKFLSQDTLEKLRTRAVYLKPKLPKDIPICGAAIGNGKICQRRDLHTCPYHGPKKPRDKYGDVIVPRPENDEKTLAEREAEADPDVPDVFVEMEETTWSPPPVPPETTAKAAASSSTASAHRPAGTTVPTAVGRQTRKRPHRKPYANLIDVKQTQDTSMSRLQRRLDDRRMNRVISEDLKKRENSANLWSG
ncbi:hypothetical protein IWQ60_003166 [Tieghemiomyces parasiticus]|uniref:UV-stimulated scaffold protein A C-terminal domain-containing protein n=1 Tax=Tieghemiomyces parasiticus TaxID=78921 RepID=A0A9W8DV18_9FUNG|nr:hypothetical protein IWQ60_003166 [Tieghemiomyces parasiticus]